MFWVPDGAEMTGEFARRDSRKKRLDQPPTAEFLKLRFFRVLIRPGVDDQPKWSAETWPGGLPSAAGHHRRNSSSRTAAAPHPATIAFHMLIRQFPLPTTLYFANIARISCYRKQMLPDELPLARDPRARADRDLLANAIKGGGL